MTKAYERFRTLQFLLRFLCEDCNVSLKLGDDWFFSPTERCIYVSAKMISQNSLADIAWFLIHEIGSVKITRCHKFYAHLDSKFPWRDFFVCLEEERVSRWMINLYPQTKVWHDKSVCFMHCDAKNIYPLLRQFNYGCAMFGREMSSNSFIPNVADALSATRLTIEKYVNTIPKKNARNLIRRENIRDIQLAESEIIASAKSAFDMAMTNIFPIARELFLLDVAKLQSFMKSKADLWRNRERLSETLSSQASMGLVWGSKNAEIDRRVLRKRYFDPLVLKIYVNSFDRTSNRGLTTGKWRGITELSRILRSSLIDMGAISVSGYCDVLNYQDTAQMLEQQIASLSQEIVRLGRRNEKIFNGGFSSGAKINLKAALQSGDAVRRHGHIWQSRREAGGNTKSAFLLLIDLSLYMRDAIDVAFQSAVLLSETLARLRIPFAVYGFQERLLRVKGFQEVSRATISEAFDKMSLDVLRNSPDRNSQSFCNDSGSCLLEVAKVIRAFPVQQRVIIVISDGYPEGRQSNTGDLRSAVAMISQDPSINLIGIGLGPNTEHVLAYYPDAVANVGASELSEVLGRCLRHHLGGSNEIQSREVVMEGTPF